MSVPHSSPEASTSSSMTSRSVMLPSLSLFPLDVEDFSAHISQRSSADSDSDSAKAKDRSSTAARRASHNAVERQRRDKLNARILELASLLPNLAGVRRPSRIAITKSSIAHIHSSRRHRMLAAQQLRILHAENESLRLEVNQWRGRAGVPGSVEPRRGDAFMLVLTGAELDLDPVDVGEDEEYDEHYANGMPYPCPPPMHQRSFSPPQSESPLRYGISPPSSSASSSSSSSFPSHYSTPYSSPSSASNASGFALPAYVKYNMAPAHEPRIACPSPANSFEAPHFMLKSEDEWAMYGAPPTHFQDEPLASW
ncbi:hypothetical protein B0H17DRAFT_1103615 [Mycena rosella]|uniref:BHLH domain-containing protein n=1 Tax=Mycena rosella TaxID=1033263 RepID=A0AAD7FZI0_MYCRO|nr:hypothetical protein B0H17DRAFT_1103615 [Mycena rosella]